MRSRARACCDAALMHWHEFKEVRDTRGCVHEPSHQRIELVLDSCALNKHSSRERESAGLGLFRYVTHFYSLVLSETLRLYETLLLKGKFIKSWCLTNMFLFSECLLFQMKRYFMLFRCSGDVYFILLLWIIRCHKWLMNIEMHWMMLSCVKLTMRCFCSLSLQSTHFEQISNHSPLLLTSGYI